MALVIAKKIKVAAKGIKTEKHYVLLTKENWNAIKKLMTDSGNTLHAIGNGAIAEGIKGARVSG